MSDATPPANCGIHFSPYDENGECTWCRRGQGFGAKLAPYVLTADDIKFLTSYRINPEQSEASDFTADPGGD
jgi:hypothetical protein